MKVLLLVSNVITCERDEVDVRYFTYNDDPDVDRETEKETERCVGVELDLELERETSTVLRLLHGTELQILLDSLSATPSPSPSHTVLRFPPGCTLLPGFVDCHVHLSIPVDDYQLRFLQTSSASHALTALRSAQGLLHSGFTTVRTAGDADLAFPSFAVRDSVRRGEFVGPRVVGAGHYISVTGGGGDLNMLAADNCRFCPADGVVADGRDAMLLAVRKEIKYGSDWIKLLVTGAFMTASTNAKDSPENTHFSTEELKICVEEASRRRVPVMAHAHGAEGIVLAAKAGVRSIEHASFIDEDGIAACIERGTWIVPTFLVGAYFDSNGSESGAQNRMIDLQRKSNKRYYDCISKAVKAGVKVALGSDYVGWDPSITALEFKYMVERASMTPMQSIYAGTGSAADLLDIQNIGRIMPGKLADLVVVQGNPLRDITHLQRSVVFVMHDGLIVRDDLRVSQHMSPAHVANGWYRPGNLTQLCGNCK